MTVYSQRKRVAIYVVNQGVSQAALTEVRFGGAVYNYVPGGTLDDFAATALHGCTRLCDSH